MFSSYKLRRLLHAMAFRALKVLFLISFTSFPVSGISVDMASGVIVEIGRKFSSGGVYLLVSSEEVAGGWWTDLARFLITAHTLAAVINLEKASIFLFPSATVSVCVMHSAAMKDVSALREVHGRTFGPKLLLIRRVIQPLSSETVYVTMNILFVRFVKSVTIFKLLL
jgi:hypothetical protein